MFNASLFVSIVKKMGVEELHTAMDIIMNELELRKEEDMLLLCALDTHYVRSMRIADYIRTVERRGKE